MIVSFKCKKTARLFAGQSVREFRAVRRQAEQALFMIANADILSDLRSPPGNMLEALHGDREGQHSIRVNKQWRVCFVWTHEGAKDVEIVDYH